MGIREVSGLACSSLAYAKAKKEGKERWFDSSFVQLADSLGLGSCHASERSGAYFHGRTALRLENKLLRPAHDREQLVRLRVEKAP